MKFWFVCKIRWRWGEYGTPIALKPSRLRRFGSDGAVYSLEQCKAIHRDASRCPSPYEDLPEPVFETLEANRAEPGSWRSFETIRVSRNERNQRHRNPAKFW